MKRIVLYLLVAGLLWSARGWCGTGTYTNKADGTPDEILLKVNLEFPHANEVEVEWRPLFERASRLLFEATEGQVRISDVIFYTDCPRMADDADVRIFPGLDPALASVDGLGNAGYSIFLSQLHKSVVPPELGQLGLVHELGHYVFALLDEYRDKNGDESDQAGCVIRPDGGRDETASIMDAGTLLRNTRTEFCVDSNHHREMTEQDKPRKIDGQPFENTAGWPWIKAWMRFRHGASLNPPIDKPVSNSGTPVAGPAFRVVSCSRPIPPLRAAVGIDRSGSMSASPAARREDMAGPGATAGLLEAPPIDAVKEGADTLIRLLDEEDVAGVVEAGGDFGVHPLAKMTTDNKFELLASIDEVHAGGRLDWTDLLSRSFEQITRDGDGDEGTSLAGKEVIILLSDGRQGTQEEVGSEELTNLLSSVKHRGVVVHAVGVANAEAVDLRRAVTQTGGNFLFSGDTSQMNAAVMTLLAQIKKRGIIAAQEGSVEPGRPGKPPLEIQVPVDQATSAAAVELLLTWSGSGRGLAIELKDAKGEVVDPRAEKWAEKVSLTEGFGKRLVRYWVNQPEAGAWTITITNSGSSARDFAFQAHSLAQGVTFAAHAEKDVVALSDPLVLKAIVATDYPVAGAKVMARIERPEGEPVTVDLYDDGDLEHQDERANDGAYSGIFDEYQGAGSYNVDVTVDSAGGFTVFPGEPGSRTFVSEPVEPFVRKARFSVVVQDVPESAGER